MPSAVEADGCPNCSIAEAFGVPLECYDSLRLAAVLEGSHVATLLAQGASTGREADLGAEAVAVLAAYRACGVAGLRPDAAADEQLWRVFQLGVQHSSYWLSLDELLLLAKLRSEPVRLFVANEVGELRLAAQHQSALDVPCPWILCFPQVIGEQGNRVAVGCWLCHHVSQTTSGSQALGSVVTSSGCSRVRLFGVTRQLCAWRRVRGLPQPSGLLYQRGCLNKRQLLCWGAISMLP